MIRTSADSKDCKDSAPLERPKNFVNVKSKRKRFLFKKAIELAQMCSLDVFIAIRDQEQEKMSTYCSGSLDCGRPLFTVERAMQSLKEFETLTRKVVKVFTDDDYG